MAYGNVSNLQKAGSLFRVKSGTFLRRKNSQRKYRKQRRRFPRFKVIAYDIKEIWSFDLAYVNKLAKYNNGFEYFLVDVVVLSRKLRVQPLGTKGAEENAKRFRCKIIKPKPLKVWPEKERSSKRPLENSVKGKEWKLASQTVKRSLHLQSAIFDLSETSSINI